MTIEYNEFQRSEDCALDIYRDLKKLPLEIREKLQDRIRKSPLAERDIYFTDALKICRMRKHSLFDVSSELSEEDD